LAVHTHIQFVQTSHHSAAEHGASTRILHLTLFLASVFDLCPGLCNSFGLLKHRSSPCIPRSPPCPICLGDFTLGLVWLCYRTVFVNVWPSHPPLRFLICKSILGCFMRFHSSLFVIWSSHKVLNIFLRHLLTKTCSLAVIFFEFFQVSQPSSRTAFTFVLKMRSLVCVEYAIEYTCSPSFFYSAVLRSCSSLCFSLSSCYAYCLH
jgi:hypothetical protein